MTYVPLKNYFGVELAHRLSALIEPFYPEFPGEAFAASVAKKVEPLELKARVAVITEELNKALPFHYSESLKILLNIIGPENKTEKGMFTDGYFLMPIAHFVEKYGLQDFEVSMNALYEITKRHTSEYAIRPYLINHVDDCIRILSTWSKDENFHIRRLVSEGTRPILPWAKRIDAIKGDPANNFVLLEPLLDDSSLYVRKSVANHLNDLTKDYKEMMIEWIRDRLEYGGEYISWIARHALRSQAKAGDNEVLELLKNL